MKKQQSGFTMIELIMVIGILGILAAFALPRFADFSGQARSATVEGIAGSMRSASAIAHAAQLAAGDSGSASVELEGIDVTMIGGYPTADDDGIVAAAQIDGVETSTGAATSGAVLYVAPNGGTADASSTCVAVYTAAVTTSGSEAPAKVEVKVNGCDS